MAKLAIQGHISRGKEVIEILEMLGGKKNFVVNGNTSSIYRYYIDSCDEINVFTVGNEDLKYEYITFTLEEFLKKFPYKVGDKVNYVKYNDEYPSVHTIQRMRWTGTTIEYLLDSSDFSALTKDLQPYKEQEIMKDNSILNQLIEYFNNTPRDVIEKEWHEYDKYNEIGPTVKEYLEYIGKPKYPKTYAECCEVLVGRKPNQNEISFDKMELCLVDSDNAQNIDFQTLQLFPLDGLFRLLMCRNAYWKLAGEQMGLGKPWEPDYTEESWEQGCPSKYVIYFNGTCIVKERKCTPNYILSFPTEEMRDIFYANFKDLIEQCKKLL